MHDCPIIRYYICDAAWPKDPSQIQDSSLIFFLGNELPLTLPQQPIVFENARRLNSLVVELEVRWKLMDFFTHTINMRSQLHHDLTHTTYPCMSQHRYYGSSVPFGKAGNVSSLTTGEFKWLTIEQVLADSVAVIR